MNRLTAFPRRVRRDGFTPTEFLSICIGALFLLSIIVVSGGVVRLTGSGLGCTDWPNCNESNLISVSNAHSMKQRCKTWWRAPSRECALLQRN